MCGVLQVKIFTRIHPSERFVKRSLVLMVLVGSFLRFYMLGSESIWLDEAASLQYAEENVLKLFSGEIHDPGNPSLYYLLLHFWIQLFGVGEVGLRSLSAVFGILGIPLIYMLGRKLFDAETGLMAAFLLSVSSFHIYFSQEARMYSLAMFLTLFSALLFYRGLTESENIFWVGYVASSILSLYTHFMTVFILLSQAVFFIFFYWKHRSSLRIWLASQLSIALVFLPEFKDHVLPTFFIQRTYFYWQPRLDLTYLAWMLNQFVGEMLYIPPFLLLLIVLLVPVTLILLATLPSMRRKVEYQPLSFLLLYLLFPIYVVFLLSLRLGFPRYFIVILPAFLIVVARALLKVIKISLKRSMILAVGVFSLILLVNSLPIYVLYSEVDKEQWREAANFIQNESVDDEIILISAPYQEMTFNYYYKGKLRVVGLPKPNVMLTEDSVHTETSNYGCIFLIYSHSEVTDPEMLILKTLKKSYEVVYLKEFYGIQIYFFEKRT